MKISVSASTDDSVVKPTLAVTKNKTWWILPTFCTVLSLIMIPMPEIVDAINARQNRSYTLHPVFTAPTRAYNESNEHTASMFEWHEIEYQLPLRCEACVFNVRRKLLRQFGDQVRNVLCELNPADLEKGRTVVCYDRNRVTPEQITQYIQNDILRNTADRRQFNVVRNS
mmetsp:Transcript_46986/g.78002  ORF Transcript_46986/g.78002 Transcript_46986/m.78002 type:complete len:170 (+) Transcript_46986:1-510(+)